MPNIEHVLISYGDDISYHLGAKAQILKSWKKWYSNKNISISIVTDKPEFFNDFPARTLVIDPDALLRWSCDGSYKFGIKIKAFQWAIETGAADIYILQDVDMFWMKPPLDLISKISVNCALMYKDEGLINSKNKNGIRFFNSLSGKKIQLKKGSYELSKNSRMIGSATIGIATRNYHLLSDVYDLFLKMSPLVNAHTVEQFCFAEIFRINNVKLIFSSKYLQDWSTSGKKNYVTPLLHQFFSKYGQLNFSKQVDVIENLSFSRPLKFLIRQKFKKVWK